MDCKKRILVVEDNVGSRQLLALVLGRSGYDITEAATGLEAVEQARATRPDLIIMDLGLPGITGDEATARLKADVSTRDIPVIVNTAFPKESSRVERAIAAGAALILYKPTSLKVFEEVARRYLIPGLHAYCVIDWCQPVTSPVPSFRQFPQSFLTTRDNPRGHLPIRFERQLCPGFRTRTHSLRWDNVRETEKNS